MTLLTLYSEETVKEMIAKAEAKAKAEARAEAELEAKQSETPASQITKNLFDQDAANKSLEESKNKK